MLARMATSSTAIVYVNLYLFILPRDADNHHPQSTGRHCDTTAEQETIAGAIEHHIKNNGHKICGTQCLELTHGGTWHGYLLIGPASNFDHKAYCGPKVSFKHCDSGGKGDMN